MNQDSVLSNLYLLKNHGHLPVWFDTVYLQFKQRRVVNVRILYHHRHYYYYYYTTTTTNSIQFFIFIIIIIMEGSYLVLQCRPNDLDPLDKISAISFHGIKITSIYVVSNKCLFVFCEV